MFKKIVLVAVLMLGFGLQSFSQYSYMPIVTCPATGLTGCTVMAGTVQVGGTAVSVSAVASGTLTLINSKSSCTRPAFSSCNAVYANSSGTVAIDSAAGLPTAFGTGNTILAFITTSGGNVVALAYPWYDPRAEPPDVVNQPAFAWSNIGAAAGNLSIANTTYTTAISQTNPTSGDAWTISFGTATSTSNLLTLSDGASNTGSGYLLNVANNATSAAGGVKITTGVSTLNGQALEVLDVTGNTNTNPLVRIHTVGSSTAPPFQATADGTANGVQLSKLGVFSTIGTGVTVSPGNVARLTTSDWSCGTGGTVSSCTSAVIIGSGGNTPWTFTLPLQTLPWHIRCDGVVGQATADTANQWNLLTATNGAANVTASYIMGTAATAMAVGAVTDTSATTSTFQIAPSWTLGGTATKMPFVIDIQIEGASASGTVASVQLVAPTVGDLVTIYRGAGCVLY